MIKLLMAIVGGYCIGLLCARHFGVLGLPAVIVLGSLWGYLVGKYA